jgi:putative hydrolase of HD superfamily
MATPYLTQQLEFLQTIDALKNVERASPLIDQSRSENSAEHSWHVAIYAIVLSDHASENVDIGRVVQMLLLHDIVEIDAGDFPIHGSNDPTEQEQLERRAADRIFGQLPPDQDKKLRSLWDEFEAAITPDAQFAKSLDRLQPLIQNIATGGGTWNQHSLTEQQVSERYGPQIERGSRPLWIKARELVGDFFSRSQ